MPHGKTSWSLASSIFYHQSDFKYGCKTKLLRWIITQECALGVLPEY